MSPEPRYSVTKEIKWKHFGRENNDTSSAIGHLAKAEKDQFRPDLFALITSRKSLTIISCVTSVEAAYRMASVTCQDDVYHLTYKGVTERFQYFLQDASKEIGSPQYGMIISDHRMGIDDEKLRRHHHGLVDRPDPYSSSYKNLIETIQFAPSHFGVGLQLADMVAGAIQRAFQSRDRIRGASFALVPTFSDRCDRRIWVS